MNQPSLFEPLTRATDPQTSRDAAERIAPHVGSLRDLILAALAHRDMTDDELCQALEMPVRRWPSVKTARSWLSKHGGRVVWSGVERDGQRVWRLA